MNKTTTLVTSRIRVTKNKKILYRATQQGHKKAKETGNVTRSKRRLQRAHANIFKKVAQKYPHKTSK